MNTEVFFKLWHIDENPFRAEEAKDDDIFQRLIDKDSTHPDFDKIYGQPESPAPAVVFGEKGSVSRMLKLVDQLGLEINPLVLNIESQHRHPQRGCGVILR